MIREIVLFHLLDGMSREDTIAKYRLSVPSWRANPACSNGTLLSATRPARSTSGAAFLMLFSANAKWPSPMLPNKFMGKIFPVFPCIALTSTTGRGHMKKTFIERAPRMDIGISGFFSPRRRTN